MVIGKHARSKIRKKGSCKPLSSEFKEGFFTIIGGHELALYKWEVLPKNYPIISNKNQ